jgi:hypothetical protein
MRPRPCADGAGNVDYRQPIADDEHGNSTRSAYHFGIASISDNLPLRTEMTAMAGIEQTDLTRCNWQDLGAEGLGPQHVQAYHEHGFVIVEDALAGEQVEELRVDATAICRGDHGEYRGWVGPHDGQSDDEVMRQYLCIHFPHKISDVMKRYLSPPAMVDVLTKVIGPNVKCMQSMLFIKAAGKPGQAWHQDEFYIPTRDRSLTGGWIAMDDATVDNGCLWVIPGSHRHGVLWPQHSTTIAASTARASLAGSRIPMTMRSPWK